MYNLNTIRGKKERIENLSKLYKKLSNLKPTDEFTINDIQETLGYLQDVKENLQAQVNEETIFKI